MATTTIPEKYKDLFDSYVKAFAQLATIMPDGSPQVTPVWFDLHDGKIRVNTARGRVWISGLIWSSPSRLLPSIATLLTSGFSSTLTMSTLP